MADFTDGGATKDGIRSQVSDDTIGLIRDIAEIAQRMRDAPTLATADPRFWVVQQHVWHEVPDGHDGEMFVWDAGGVNLMTQEDFATEWMERWLEDNEPTGTEVSLGSSVRMRLCDGGDPDNAYDWEVVDIDRDALMDDIEDGLAGGSYEIVWRQWQWEAVDNTMFLTLDECEDHIRANAHHYDHPRSFCMRAWRSPDVKRLWKALKGIDWEHIMEVVGE